MIPSVLALWLAAFVAFLRVTWRMAGAHQRAWLDIPLVAGIAAITLPCWQSDQFFGNEYEDAYEYQAAGAILSQNANWHSVLNPVCLVGTLQSCLRLGTLSHPIGLAALLSVPCALTGSDLDTAARVSGMFFVATSVAVYLLGRQLHAARSFAWLAVFFWLSTPTFLVLGTTTFAEPAAACLLLAACLAYSDSPARSARLGDFVSMVVLLLASVLVRRDLAILLIAFPAHAATQGGSGAFRRVAVAVATATGLALCFGKEVFWMPGDLHGHEPWFALHRVPGILSAFAMDWVNPLRFGLLFPAVIVGLAAIRRFSATTGVGALLCCFVLMFCSFGQGFYDVAHGAIPSVHVLRYSYEIGPLASLVAASGFRVALAKYWRADDRGLVPFAAAVILAANFAAVDLGASLARVEQDSRFAPILGACRAIDSGATLVAAESSLSQILCPRVKVVSYSALDDEVVVQEVDRAIETGSAYYLQGFEAGAPSRERWVVQRSVIEARLPRRVYGEPGGLYRLVSSEPR